MQMQKANMNTNASVNANGNGNVNIDGNVGLLRLLLSYYYLFLPCPCCYYTGTPRNILLFMFLLMYDNMKIFFQVIDFSYGLLLLFFFCHLAESIE